MQYRVEQRFGGWWGGFGSSEAIGDAVNARAAEGWRLCDVESRVFLWMWVFPRPKLLLVFERESAG